MAKSVEQLNTLPATETIAGAYQRFGAAFGQRDLQAVGDMLTENYVWQLSTGERYNRSESLRVIQEFWETCAPDLTFCVTINILNASPDEITVRAVELVSAGRDPLAAGYVRTAEEVEEYWTADAGQWVLASTRVIRAIEITS